ncbi:MAG: hypothetical protein CLLPBCKN_005068 [Chroococcidiopsis cubana SAG 39.79]|jgi:hypothetical protein|nr:MULTISPECIES: hypothetical protein [Chroococcidiopsis]MDZ4875648.1 hypothetical protein [Chroococcidiopsis cubana SAG 39.79]
MAEGRWQKAEGKTFRVEDYLRSVSTYAATATQIGYDEAGGLY